MAYTFEAARLGKLILASALTMGALVACGGDDDNSPVVSTTSGPVRGNNLAASNSYLGIPYAAPPVGELRWKAPAAAPTWTSTRDVKAFAPHCAQPASPYGTASTSEDCLYLNVYAPKSGGPHPVMVWIHGGAFYLGQSDAYNPEALVAQGNVVVTINYRLGALGFLAHPLLTAEHGTASGNYGLMDQQAALRWVRDNITNFGGNKNNVTIFGESAGGFSVNSHLASPGSANLFHKAIAMSGAYPFGAGQESLATASGKGVAITTAAGCPAPQTLACLRSLTPTALFAANAAPTAYPSGPVPLVDGVVLTKDVRASFAANEQHPVPVIQGNTHDEWRLFVAAAELGGSPPVTSGTFQSVATATLGPIVGAAVPAYPVAQYDNNASFALGALGTDAVFACSGRVSGKLLATPAGRTVYSYEFNDPDAPQTLPGTVSFKTGSAHTSELQYLFTMPGSAMLTASQRDLSAAIVRYFSRFAATGNPNGGADLAWPQYTATGGTYLKLAPTLATITDTAFTTDHKCTAIWTQGI